MIFDKVSFPGRNEYQMLKKTLAITVFVLVAIVGSQGSVVSANGSNIINPPPNCLTIIAGIQVDGNPTDEFCDPDHINKSRVDVLYIAKHGFLHRPGITNLGK